LGEDMRAVASRIVQTDGDSLLIVFDSMTGRRCAMKVQQQVPLSGVQLVTTDTEHAGRETGLINCETIEKTKAMASM
jgi:hypothetical protein